MTVVKKKATVYPSKTDMNLAMREKPATTAPKALIAVVVVIIIVAAVCKFGVIDRYKVVAEAEAQAAAAQSSLAELQKYTDGYDELLAEYAKYSNGGLTEDEAALADRLDVLSLMEKKLLGQARVETLAAVDNMVTVRLSGITLDQLSAIISALYTDDSVSGVVVSTVGSTDNEGGTTTAALTITLEGGGQK